MTVGAPAKPPTSVVTWYACKRIIHTYQFRDFWLRVAFSASAGARC